MSNSRPNISKITDSIYSYIGITNPSPKNSLGANRGVIIGRDYAVAVDSGISFKEAKRFTADILAVSQKPVKFLINTHSHPDHVFGNSEFAQKNTIIISHEKCKTKFYDHSVAAELEKLKDVGLTEDDMAGTTVTYPSLTFDSKMELDLGTLTIKILYFGQAHTAGDILIYIPKEKLLFTGDILETDYHPYVGDPEADIDGWIRVLDKIIELDVQIIIPGHGPISGKKEVVEFKKYLTAFDNNAKRLAKKKKAPSEIATELEEILPKRSEMNVVISANIFDKYLSK